MNPLRPDLAEQSIKRKEIVANTWRSYLGVSDHSHESGLQGLFTYVLTLSVNHNNNLKNIKKITCRIHAQ